MQNICQNLGLQGLFLQFASIVGGIVAIAVIRWLKTMLSNFYDEHQHNSVNDANRIERE